MASVMMGSLEKVEGEPMHCFLRKNATMTASRKSLPKIVASSRILRNGGGIELGNVSSSPLSSDSEVMRSRF